MYNHRLIIIKILLIIILLITNTILAINDIHIENLQKILDNGLIQTNNAIHNIFQTWSIDEYPKFLKSCAMPKHSWDMLKFKYMHRILSAYSNKTAHSLGQTLYDSHHYHRKDFVISFLGSSVAAGHDSYFNQSYPILVGDIMIPVFKSIGIDLDSRNVALGNNPCMPYDICVSIFSGNDADIIQWEQSYNCGNHPILEQFIRQAMVIPSQPIIVFSESQTAHWGLDKCNSQQSSHTLDDEEKELLRSHAIKIVSELNKNEIPRAWSVLGEMIKHYKGAGIQTFTHTAHEQYACLGPYIKDWEKGAAAWHPSAIAHRLRASHHSYFWLLCLKDAIVELSNMLKHRPLDQVAKEVSRHIIVHHRPVTNPIHKSRVIDNMKCFSDYEPRTIREASLTGRVISGLAKNSNEKGWKNIIYEDLVHENLVKQSLKFGYKDFKHLIWGETDAGDLSIVINVMQEGPVFICETPGIWGALPDQFEHLWDAKPEVFFTFNVTNTNEFNFSKDKAVQVSYLHEKDMEICMLFEKPIGIGQHVMTISPKGSNKIILAWVLHP